MNDAANECAAPSRMDTGRKPRNEMELEENFEGIIGRSAAMGSLRSQIKIVAPTDATVLILGETGSGKELIAQAIHHRSSRRQGPFVKVSCVAIPTGLIESELFGHERGAFTGALSRRAGRFEMANGGTLFLDEIGDIPAELQPKLLRVLQEREFERVGAIRTSRVDVRVVAATNRNLAQMMTTKEFRADLYYRLNVFPIRVPALRERSDDIPSLVHCFVKRYAERMKKRVTIVPDEVMDCFRCYSWPGNVRELENIIERAVILSPGDVLQASPEDLWPVSQTAISASTGNGHMHVTLKDMEREHITRVLAATNWVVGGPSGAGARLGLPRTTLIAKMQRLGITRVQNMKG
ncbi:MAG TPA: sigma 54-interacting transcriptional regulator [Verrucomicrobiae bacterium]